MSVKVGFVAVRALAYAEGLRDVPRIELEGLYEPDTEKSGVAAAREGVSRVVPTFEELVDRCDAVVIGSPMQFHAQQTVAALAADKPVLCEVTAAVNMDECKELTKAAGANKAFYCMSENYLHFRENVIVGNMAAEGLFGEPTFAEGEYIHEVRNLHHNPDGTPTWRYEWQVGMRGCTYGTHSLGPCMRWIRTVDPEDHIVTVSCAGTGPHTDPEHPQDDTTLMLCQTAHGRLIKVRLDMMSNRPHQIYYSLQGTQGVYESGRAGCPPQVWIGEGKDGDHREWRPLSDFDHFLPEEYRQSKGGHGGGDYHVGRLFGEALLGQREPDVPFHDALEWTVAGLLSQESILKGGIPLPMPEFVRQNPVS